MYSPYQTSNDNSSYSYPYMSDNTTTTGYNAPTHRSTTK